MTRVNNLRGRRPGAAQRAVLGLPERPEWMTDARRRCSMARPDWQLWTSEVKAEQTVAAGLCKKGCPFVDECRAWAVSTGETAHVWGGLNFNREADRQRGASVAEQAPETPDKEDPADTALIERALGDRRFFDNELNDAEKGLVIRGGLARGWPYSRMTRRWNRRIADLQRLAEPDKPTLDDRVRELNAQGCNDSQIASELGVSSNVISDSRRLQGLPVAEGWRATPRTDDAEAELRRRVTELWAKDLPDGVIGLRLNLNPGSVCKIRRRIGLPAKFGSGGRRLAVPA